MKKSFIAIIAIAAMMLVLAWNSGYDLKKRLAVALPVAYQAAMKALGPATNQFYCVSVFLDGAFPKGDWVLRFCSTNLAERYVTVSFEGAVEVATSYER